VKRVPEAAKARRSEPSCLARLGKLAPLSPLSVIDEAITDEHNAVTHRGSPKSQVQEAG
jgi:hypothetical protein